MRCCLLLLLAITARPAGAQSVAADSAAVVALEIELTRLLAAGRIDEYARHLASDYFRTTADGRLQSREAALAEWRAFAAGRPAETEALPPVDIMVRVYGDAAILTAVLVDSRGGPRTRITKTFVRRGGAWLLASLAGSPIGPQR
jgi:hypothetical protein